MNFIPDAIRKSETTRAAVLFSVLALVVLPLLPDGQYGPYNSVRPRELWIVVLLFSGLNFAGYLARRAIGTERGYGVTGLLGGLVSSTAVTLHFSRKSKREPHYAGPLGLGVVAACTVLVPRVIIVASLLERDVGVRVMLFLALPFLIGAGFVTVVLRRAERERETALPHEPQETTVIDAGRNPLGLGHAIQMAVAFQLVLLALAWVQNTVGTPGVLMTAALLGLTDVDALTLSMSRLGADAAMQHLAATAIAVGVLANTLLKLTLTLVLGSRPFQQRASLGLLALALASGAGLALGAWIVER